MKKIRLLAAAALLVVPLLVPNVGYSISSLPAISTDGGTFGQQTCPAEGQPGCLNPSMGGSGMIGFIFSNADSFRRERLETCLQFMQRLRNFGAWQG